VSWRHRLWLVAGVVLVLLALVAPRAAHTASAYGPYLQDIVGTAATIRWVTAQPSRGAVEYGTSPQLGEEAREAVSTRFHMVRIHGLPPSGRCYYRVRDAGVNPHVYSFPTPVDPGEPFTFAAYGDTRTNATVHSEVIHAILSARPKLAIQTGDLVADGSKWPLWEEYLTVAGPLLAEVPVYPVPGNHEGESSYYYRLFGPGGERHAYSFDYGGCHFLGIDGERSYLRSDMQWIRRDLATHRNARFTVVFLHYPPYTAQKGRIQNARYLRTQLVPVLRYFGVDLVLAGHDHNYQHYVVDGVHYVVTGGGGAPLYDVGESGVRALRRAVANEASLMGVRTDLMALKLAKAYHYVLFTVDGHRMTARVLKPNGELIDSFVVRGQEGGAAYAGGQRRGGAVASAGR